MANAGFHKNCACQWKNEIDSVLFHVKQLFFEVLFQLSIDLLIDFVSLFVFGEGFNFVGLWETFLKDPSQPQLFLMTSKLLILHSNLKRSHIASLKVCFDNYL